jgi:hypothetical protein
LNKFDIEQITDEEIKNVIFKIINEDDTPVTPESSGYAYVNEFAYLNHSS